MGILNKELNYPHEWDASLENIKYIFSGKGSLRSAFWGIYVLTTAITISIAMFLIVFYSIFIENFELLKWYIKNIYLFVGIIQLISCYSVVKCSKNTIKKHWAIIAVIFSLTNALLNIYDGINNI